jgi:hypothetical protein
VHEEREPPGHGGTPRRTNHTVHALRARTQRSGDPTRRSLAVCMCHTVSRQVADGGPGEPSPNRPRTRYEIFVFRTIHEFFISSILSYSRISIRDIGSKHYNPMSWSSRDGSETARV